MLAREPRTDRIRSNDPVIWDLQSYRMRCIRYLLRVEATFHSPTFSKTSFEVRAVSSREAIVLSPPHLVVEQGAIVFEDAGKSFVDLL